MWTGTSSVWSAAADRRPLSLHYLLRLPLWSRLDSRPCQSVSVSSRRLFSKRSSPASSKGPASRFRSLDAGAGQFSQKLSTKDWMEFANSQRAHGQTQRRGGSCSAAGCSSSESEQANITAWVAHSLCFHFSGVCALCARVSGNYVEGAARARQAIVPSPVLVHRTLFAAFEFEFNLTPHMHRYPQ